MGWLRSPSPIGTRLGFYLMTLGAFISGRVASDFGYWPAGFLVYIGAAVVTTVADVLLLPEERA